MGRIIKYKSVNNAVFIEFENKRKVNIEIIDGAIIRVYEPYDNSDFSFAISEKVLGNISHKINKIQPNAPALLLLILRYILPDTSKKRFAMVNPKLKEPNRTNVAKSIPAIAEITAKM